MSTAFIFPGQASSLNGAGRAWARALPDVNRLVHVAAERMGVPSRAFESPAATMDTTRFQPLMMAMGLGIADALVGAGVRPAAVAGHSFGELTAAAAAGCIAPDAAMHVAIERGRLMAEAARQRPGGMVAVRAGSQDDVHALLATGRAHGIAVLAGRNTGDQWILSGDQPALDAMAQAARVTRVPVEGAWHSPLLSDIVPEYEALLRQAVQRPTTVPFVSNHAGRVVRHPHELVELLVGQLTRGIDWTDTMASLRGLGVTDYVICGPSPALSRFVKTLHPAAQVHCVAWPEDLHVAAASLRAEHAARAARAVGSSA